MRGGEVFAASEINAKRRRRATISGTMPATSRRGGDGSWELDASTAGGSSAAGLAQASARRDFPSNPWGPIAGGSGIRSTDEITRKPQKSQAAAIIFSAHLSIQGHHSATVEIQMDSPARQRR